MISAINLTSIGDHDDQIPYFVVLIGHYGTGKTLVIVQIIAVRIENLVLKGKRVRLIVTADVSDDSILLKNLKEKYLDFIKNINSRLLKTGSPELQVRLIVEPLDSLIKKHKAIPNTNIDLVVLQKVSEQSLFDENGWMKKGYPDIVRGPVSVGAVGAAAPTVFVEE